jgi:hypothetical protein
VEIANVSEQDYKFASALQERIETDEDESDLEEVYNTEHHLHYVACRARDHLLITSAEYASEFLRDLE